MRSCASASRCRGALGVEPLERLAEVGEEVAVDLGRGAVVLGATANSVDAADGQHRGDPVAAGAPVEAGGPGAHGVLHLLGPPRVGVEAGVGRGARRRPGRGGGG